ncbi:MAG: TonB-dependent receptor [Ferrovibrio sp.]|uniref:TonB-dependent receptor n=1 Tax=Ferrovibrio sp. TaxID=1917215 RepID=UPI002604B326|nr:TonB-dependent receptor [Ferrovibrio sp.]MCW0235454.1 TonB-dependent receptor [Ferrovibrio sp.]
MSSAIRRRLLLGGSLLLLPAAGVAQETPTTLSPVVVTAPLQQSQDELAEGTTVLQGEALDRRRAATLGEMLDGTPGVSSTQFGPGAGRPVIRGQSGPRVRVLNNGIDTFDASTVSPDHAVVAPVGGAQRIEVLRGPAALLYGSSAIGGVVNVIDGRIPEAAPKNGTAGTARLDYGSGASEKSGFAAIDQAVTDRFVVHGEAGALNADDYSIDGYASTAARAAGRKGRVDNTGIRNRNGSVGASYLGEAGYAGASVTQFNSYYGVPGSDPVRIDMSQTRLDTKFGLYEPLRFLDEVKLKFGYADYLHDEIEPNGQPATRFDSESWEARLEAVHKPIFAGIEGVVGLQSNRRDLTATGAEAFITPTVTDSHALFVLERYETGPWGFSLGGRAEHVEIDAATLKRQRDFTPLGLSAGATYKLSPGYTAGLSLSRTERAPTAEELFSDGKHVATQSYEIGNAALNKETALHAELSLRKTAGDVTGAANVFATRFQDYIFGAFTGNQRDDVNELQYSQADADFHGGEIEAAWTFFRGAGYTLGVDGSVDYVRGEARSGSNLPRIPPVGYRSGFTVATAPLDWRIEIAGRLDQEKVGANETRTDGYTVLNTAFTWRPFDNRDVAVLLQGRNLTDEEGRNHTSLLKDVAPIRGREVRLGTSVIF